MNLGKSHISFLILEKFILIHLKHVDCKIFNPKPIPFAFVNLVPLKH